METFPLIKQMDNRGEISPKNYSKVLGVMIVFFIVALFVAYLFENEYDYFQLCYNLNK